MRGLEQTKLWSSYVEATNRAQNKIQYLNPTPFYSNKPTKWAQLCWDLTDLTEIKIKRELAKDKREKEAKQMEGEQGDLDFSAGEQELAQVQKEYIAKSKEYINRRQNQDYEFMTKHFTGKAFVSFEYQHYAYAILNHAANHPIYLDGNVLNVKMAAAPRDILWENLSVSKLERTTKLFVSFLVTVITLAAAFSILIGLDTLQTNPKTQHTTPSLTKHTTGTGSVQTIPKSFGSSIVSGLMPLFVLGVNYLLERLMSKVTDYQKHETKTNYQLSFMLKLLASQFLNTAIMYYVISIYFFEGAMWNEDGLIPQMSQLILTSAFLPIGVSIVTEIYDLAKQRWFPPFGKKHHVQIHQDRLNKQCASQSRQVQLQPFDLASRYTHYIMEVYTVSFFAYPMPFGTAALLLAFTFEFFFDKYKLFLRSSLKDDFSYEMTKISSKLFMSSVWIYAIGHFTFSYAFTRTISYLSIGLVVLTTLFLVYLWILPFRWETAIQDILQQYEPLCYSYCLFRNMFQHTYRNQNPACQLASSATRGQGRNWLVSKEDAHIVRHLQRIPA